jgi:hypothetical protein
MRKHQTPSAPCFYYYVTVGEYFIIGKELGIRAILFLQGRSGGKRPCDESRRAQKSTDKGQVDTSPDNTRARLHLR